MRIPIASLATLALSTTLSAQANVDLRTWTAESYPVGSFGVGVWTPAPDGSTVTQSINGQPTLYVSNFSAFNTTVEGQVVVNTNFDDDFFGFALGYLPGDTMNPNADYLLIDWKARTQGFTFGPPSCTPGGTADGGLAVSRVTGTPTADEFWSHSDFDEPACSPLGHGLQELARGASLGDVGWSSNTTYTFRFEFSATRLRVFVDGVLEIDVSGTFAGGRYAFYNFSQADVTYSAFTLACSAESSNYGAGWPGTAGVPGLTLSAVPAIGTSTDIMLGNAAGVAANGCFVYGFSDATTPTAFGGSMEAEAVGIVPFHPIPAVGHLVPYAIPNEVTLCGVEIFAQWLHADAGASHGVAFSRGLRIRFGL